MDDLIGVTICGSLVGESIRRRTLYGAAACSFKVSVARSWTAKSGRSQTETIELDCRAYAHAANALLKRGVNSSRLLLHGFLRNEAERLIVIATHVAVLSGLKEGSC